MTEHNQVDFSTVLASAVHDMKNSLCMLIQSIDTLSANVADKDPQEAEELARLHYEAARLNTNLLQLLSLYRVEKNQLPLNIESHYLDDVIEELVAKNELYIENLGIQVSIEIEEELHWYMDVDLISNLLNDIFINALRYSKNKILITAVQDNDNLVVHIEDNGDGYPQSMLDITVMPMQDVNLNAGRTGLGLYFARLIAGAHHNGDKVGAIKLANNSRLGGSCFTLTLP